jgi:hypothetical protein
MYFICGYLEKILHLWTLRMGDAKDNGLNKLVTTPYKINCWLLASLRKSKLTLLGRFLFANFRT